MKKLLIICSLILLTSLCFAQMTTTSATIVDPAGTHWANGSYAIDWQRPASNQGTVPTLNGVPIQEHGIGGNLDATGHFSTSLADSQVVLPTGGQWVFTICPFASSQCFVINSGNRVTGGSVDLSSFLNSQLSNPQVSTMNIPRAYNDAEVPNPPKGGFYFDITLNCLKFWTGSNFSCVGSGLPVAGNGTSLVSTNLPSGGGAGICAEWQAGGALGNAVSGLPCGSGGGGIPGGANTQVQFNDTGAFNGSPFVTFNKSLNETDIANVANIKYAVTAYNWSQTPPGTLTANTLATVTLTPCPQGIDGRDNVSSIFVSGVGTPEPVTLAGGGTCRPGLASGTITFTPLNSHSAGYTIGSGSSGIQESINTFANWTGTGGSAHATVIIKPAGAPVANGNTAYAYIINAPISNGGINALTLIGNGAVLGCNTRDFCIHASAPMYLYGFRMASNLQLNGWNITNTSCTGGVATITTSATHGLIVGDFVDIHDTDDSFYWGGSVSQDSRISAVTATTFSYPIKGGNCAAGGGSTRASAATPGTTNALNAAYYNGPGTSANGSVVQGLSLSIPGGSSSVFSGHFNNGIVVMDDEAFRVRDMTAGSLNNKSGPNFMCGFTNPYCGAQIYAPGPFTGGSAVMWISDSDLTSQCTANPIVAFNGNTLRVTNVIAQSQAKYSILSSNRRGGFGNTILENVYDEQGNCFNPDNNLSASAGYMTYGNALRVSGGEGPQANIPNFINTGPTTYYYYLVPNNGTTDAAPLFFGMASPLAPFTLQFPRVLPISSGGANVTYTNPTYSIIRTTDPNNYPTASTCQGGSTAACGLVATGLAQCATQWCSFTDNPATVTTPSTAVVGSSYLPDVTFWPGQFVLTGNATMWLDTNVLAPNGGVISLNGPGSPSVYTLRNNGNLNAWVNGFGVGAQATTLWNNNATGNLKGLLNLFQLGASVPYGELLTLVDSNPIKSLANINKRPFTDAADTYLGNDQPSANANGIGLAVGAPVAISNYINSVPNGFGSGWLERLTATKKEFNVPIQADQPITAISNCNNCSPFGFTGTQITDNFTRANGPLGANWTTVTGGCAISSNTAVFTSFSGPFNWAQCIYTGASFSNDQYAQATVAAFGAGGPNPAILVRSSNVAQTFYALECTGTGTGFYLIKVIAGIDTNLLSAVGSCHVGDVMRLYVSGSTLYPYVNGLPLSAPVTDTAITTGNPGIGNQNALTANLALFQAGDANQINILPVGSITANIVQTGSPGVFSNLPTCNAAAEGTLAAITDSNTNVWGATVAGASTNHILAYCDGTNWTVAGK